MIIMSCAHDHDNHCDHNVSWANDYDDYYENDDHDNQYNIDNDDHYEPDNDNDQCETDGHMIMMIIRDMIMVGP